VTWDETRITFEPAQAHRMFDAVMSAEGEILMPNDGEAFLDRLLFDSGTYLLSGGRGASR
jgi:hypothetical protein